MIMCRLQYLKGHTYAMWEKTKGPKQEVGGIKFNGMDQVMLGITKEGGTLAIRIENGTNLWGLDAM